MNLIRHVVIPKRLLLVWQEPSLNDKTVSEGKKYILGEIFHNGKSSYIQYFKYSDDFQEALKKGCKGYSVFDMEAKDKYEHDIMDILDYRVLLYNITNITDFDDFLKYHRIDPDVGKRMNSFTLLGYTGGKLDRDGFSFVHTFDKAKPSFEMTTEIAGLRHYCTTRKELDDIKGKNVCFECEPKNEHDTNAISITTVDGKKIGYINRAQSKTFQKWIKQSWSVSGIVERINGTETTPSGLLYVKVSK